MKPTRFRLLRFESVNVGRVLASADVEVSAALVIHGVLLLQDAPDAPPRISGPSLLAVVDADGTLAPRSCVRYRKPFRALLLAALIEAYAAQEVQP